MPETDPTFVIGVIRQKEKSLLQADEYTRLLQAPNPAEAIHVLQDTPYGLHLAEAISPLAALDARLAAEMDWLKDVLAGELSLLTFLTARYDGMHIASALIDRHEGAQQLEFATQLGNLSAELLTSVLWHNEPLTSVPSAWRSFLAEEKARLDDPAWTKQSVLEQTEAQTLRIMKGSSDSPLRRQILELRRQQLEASANLATDVPPAKLAGWERQWDESLLQLLRPYRAEPVASDAVVAWWYALALEAKTLRTLILGRLNGLRLADLQALQRSLYLDYSL